MATLVSAHAEIIRRRFTIEDHRKLLRSHPYSKPVTTLAQLLQWVHVENGHWLWSGYVGPHGYGHAGWQGKRTSASRAVYTALVGPVSKGWHVDHLCERTDCVNPAHLEAITARENTIVRAPWSPTAINAAKTHCKYGHPFDEENTITRKDRAGRGCRECKRIGERYRHALWRSEQ